MVYETRPPKTSMNNPMEESIPHATALLDVADFFAKSQRRLTIDDIDGVGLSRWDVCWDLGRSS
jgi:hypothetical protein